LFVDVELVCRGASTHCEGRQAVVHDRGLAHVHKHVLARSVLVDGLLADAVHFGHQLLSHRLLHRVRGHQVLAHSRDVQRVVPLLSLFYLLKVLRGVRMHLLQVYSFEQAVIVSCVTTNDALHLIDREWSHDRCLLLLVLQSVVACHQCHILADRLADGLQLSSSRRIRLFLEDEGLVTHALPVHGPAHHRLISCVACYWFRVPLY